MMKRTTRLALSVVVKSINKKPLYPERKQMGFIYTRHDDNNVFGCQARTDGRPKGAQLQCECSKTDVGCK